MKDENQNIVEPNNPASVGDIERLDQELARESRHNTLYRLIWLIILLLLLFALGFLGYLYARSRTSKTGNTYYVNKLDANDFLRRGEAANTGQLTVDSSTSINGDLKVSGNVVVGGTIVSSNTANYNTDVTNAFSTVNQSDYFYDQNCTFYVICNSYGAPHLGKTFAIGPNSPYLTGGVIRGAPGQVADLFELQQASGFPVFSVNNIGNVGIQNPLPQYALDVNGQARFLGHTATGNVSAIDNPSILTPLTGTPIIRVQGTQEMVSSLTPGYSFYSGSSSEYFVNLNQSASSQYFTGGYHAGEVVSGNPNNYGAVAGDAGLAIHEGSGNINLMGGLLGYAYNNSSGTINGAAGVYGYLVNKDNGTIDTGQAVGGILENPGTGTINIANGLSVNVVNGSYFGPGLSGSGVIGNANGVTAGITNNSTGTIDNASVIDIQRVLNNNTGSITNVHGLYVADQSGVGTGVSFNIYSRGVTSENAFDGKVAIGSYGALPTFGTDSRLMVNHNPAFGFQTTDNSAITQINAGLADTGLVIQGTAFGTGDLQQWQGYNGAVLGKVTSTGSVGIGTGTVTNELTVTDTSTANVAKFNGSAGTQCTVVTGVGWSCSSDESLKTNIVNITNGLDIINQLQGVTYNWKADPNGTQQDGFIAQDIQKVLPELVTTDSNGKLSLNKDGIMPYIVEAVKAQSGKVDDMNKQLSQQGIQLTTVSDELKTLADRVTNLETNDKSQDAKIQQLESEIEKLKSANSSTPATP